MAKNLIIKDMKGGNSCMDKKGQAAILGWLIVIVLVGVLVVGGIFAWNAGLFTRDTQSVIQQQKLSAGDCETAPTLSVSAIDKLSQSTTVSGITTHYRVNGQYLGTSAPSSYQKGSTVELLIANGTDYLGEKIPSFQMACGNNLVQAQLYATDTNTFRIFNTDGNPLTDNAAGGATNQSSSAAPINLRVFIDSKVRQSTGNLIIVVEAVNTTEVKDIVLSGNGATGTGVNVPNFYSPVAAGSAVDAFRVPALLNGESKEFTLQLTPESGQTIGAGDTSVYVTAYSEQDFVDTDGTYKTGVEDSDGTAKYADTWDFDFKIT